MSPDLCRHLVSHRLHGFSRHENSLSALDRALDRGVRTFEIDTRVTADGRLLVFHDARLDPLTDRAGRVCDYRFDRDGRPHHRGRDPEGVATLDEFLARLAARSGTAEVLLDVKDPGAEALHCEIVAAAGLVSRVRIMSWWPEVLLAVHAIDPDLRLVLSFVPLGRSPWWLRAVPLFGSGGLVRGLGHLRGRSRPARYMQDTIFRHGPFVGNGGRGVRGRTAGRYPVGFSKGLPEAELTDALARSGGGIATWPRVIDATLIREARARGLEVVGFSLDDREAVLRMLEPPGPDLVFTNNPDLFDGGSP